jgi:hypothetical protein
MALLFCDSFDHYTVLSDKWTTNAGSMENNPALVRTGPQSCKVQAGNAPAYSDLTNIQAPFPCITAIFGLAYLTQALNGVILKTNLGADTQVYLEINPNGSIAAKTGVGATLLGTSAAGAIAAGAFHYIEMKAKIIDDASGFVTVRVDGVIVLNVAGVQTGLANPGIDGFSLGGPIAPDFAYVDDFYLCDTSAGVNNDFLGAISVFALLPVADGTAPTVPGNWSPAFPHFSLVNEVPPNNGLTEIFTVPPIEADGYRYNVAGLPPTWPILAIQSVMDCSQDASGAGAATLFMQEASNTANWASNGGAAGPFSALGLWRMSISPADLNLITFVPWTLADFATYDFGPYISIPL